MTTTDQRLHGPRRQARYQGVPHGPHGPLADQATGASDAHGAAVARAPVHAGHATRAGAPHRSRAHLPARAGQQRVELGAISSYDAGTNTALVRLLGAQTNAIGPLAVSKAIPSGSLTAGAACLVALLDASNPADGAVIAIF